MVLFLSRLRPPTLTPNVASGSCSDFGRLALGGATLSSTSEQVERKEFISCSVFMAAVESMRLCAVAQG